MVVSIISLVLLGLFGVGLWRAVWRQKYVILDEDLVLWWGGVAVGWTADPVQALQFSRYSEAKDVVKSFGSTFRCTICPQIDLVLRETG
ncbi:hypothetical protein CPT_Seuss5 [Caulobacter phage Seuss]|uniref:Uncharacterized protein n=1 Tax=Caulobacter phage Seuss TaxID=1675601 RepID=A0A0K1LM01_9CAUD|nr:hypothetical protein HOR08_gp005 [Caulobacter phage Seuss]AKU43531.1 hypothetical protein CPT_Seuss5 [Caulobacter phage Seuss]